jgi:cation transport ATPase
VSVATFTVRLAGADCASEAQSLERILAHEPGVRRVYVNPVTSRATVEADPEVLDVAKLTALVHEAGADVLAVERSTANSGVRRRQSPRP